jgi:predicted small integral membrane protein
MNLLSSLLFTTTLFLRTTNVRICLLDLIRTRDDLLFLFLLGGSAFSSLLILLFDERPIFFFTLFFVLDASSLFL